jgi:hypothetical protein
MFASVVEVEEARFPPDDEPVAEALHEQEADTE